MLLSKKVQKFNRRKEIIWSPYPLTLRLNNKMMSAHRWSFPTLCYTGQWTYLWFTQRAPPKKNVLHQLIFKTNNLFSSVWNSWVVPLVHTKLQQHAWNHTKVKASDAPGPGLCAPSKVFPTKSALCKHENGLALSKNHPIHNTIQVWGQTPS